MGRFSPCDAIAAIFDWQTGPGLRTLPNSDNNLSGSKQSKEDEVMALTTALLNFVPVESVCDENEHSSFEKISSVQAEAGRRHSKVYRVTPKPAKPADASTDSQDSSPTEILRDDNRGLSQQEPEHTGSQLNWQPSKVMMQAHHQEKSSTNSAMKCSQSHNTENSGHSRVPLLPTRPRSQPIPIPRRSRDSKFHDEIREMELIMNEYDLATWRLYNRITDYRQRRGIVVFDSHRPPSTHENSDLSQSTASGQATNGQEPSLPLMEIPLNEEYGAIFQMDL